MLLQKEVAIGPDDTVGSLYFDRIFPLGVTALLEAADLVVAGKAAEQRQDESQASYEGWVHDAESRINWANHVDLIYNLIRGCNPAPGAWTTIEGRRLYLFDARKHVAPTFARVKNIGLGQVAEARSTSFFIHGQGGFIEVLRCRFESGKKIAAGEAGIAARTMLGT